MCSLVCVCIVDTITKHTKLYTFSLVRGTENYTEPIKPYNEYREVIVHEETLIKSSEKTKVLIYKLLLKVVKPPIS